MSIRFFITHAPRTHPVLVTGPHPLREQALSKQGVVRGNRIHKEFEMRRLLSVAVVMMATTVWGQTPSTKPISDADLRRLAGETKLQDLIEADNLLRQRTAFGTKYADEQRLLDEKERELERKKREKSAAEDEVKDLEKKLPGLKDELTAKTNAFNKAKAEYDAKDNELKAKNIELMKARLKVAQLEADAKKDPSKASDLAAAETEESRLSGEAAALASATVSLKSTMGTAQSAESKAEKAYGTADGRVNTLRDGMSALQAQISNLTGERDVKRTDAENAKRNFDRKADELRKKYSQTIVPLETKDDVSALRAEVSALKVSVGKLESKTDGMVADISQVKKDVSAMRTELHTLVENRLTTENVATTIRDAIMKLQLRETIVTDLESKGFVKKTELDAAKAQLQKTMQDTVNQIKGAPPGKFKISVQCVGYDGWGRPLYDWTAAEMKRQ